MYNYLLLGLNQQSALDEMLMHYENAADSVRTIHKYKYGSYLLKKRIQQELNWIEHKTSILSG